MTDSLHSIFNFKERCEQRNEKERRNVHKHNKLVPKYPLLSLRLLYFKSREESL